MKKNINILFCVMGRCPGPRTLIAEKRKSSAQPSQEEERPTGNPRFLKGKQRRKFFFFKYYTEMISVSFKLDHIMKRAREMPKDTKMIVISAFLSGSYHDSNGTIHPKK